MKSFDQIVQDATQAAISSIRKDLGVQGTKFDAPILSDAVNEHFEAAVDNMTNEEIKAAIAQGKFLEQEVIDHYGNEWWSER